MGHVGSSKDANKPNMNDFDLEDDYTLDTEMEDIDLDEDPSTNSEILNELGPDLVKYFCKKASVMFFDEYGLISHQINSYNQFISSGLQEAFNSFGDLTVTPGFDPSKKGDNEHYRYATVKFGNVTLERPKFWCGEGNAQELKMLPRHARLQRMTYASKMKVDVQVQVRIFFLISSSFHKNLLGFLYLFLCFEICGWFLFAVSVLMRV
jgi:DNA-directed RNA polymerase-4/5 subunit 2